MDLQNFLNLQNSMCKAYILGLLTPKIIFAQYKGNFYLVGQVVHSNQLRAPEHDISMHRNNLKLLLELYGLENEIQMVNCRELQILNISSGKFKAEGRDGFALLFDIGDEADNNIIDTDTVTQIRQSLLDATENLSENLLKYFVAGTIDGRSSVDKTLKFVSLDIDDDDRVKETLENISTRALEHQVNLNIRRNRTDEARNDQLRYPSDSIKEFLLKNTPMILLSSFRLKRIYELILNINN